MVPDHHNRSEHDDCDAHNDVVKGELDSVEATCGAIR